MGILKNFYNDIKKEAIENAHKPSKREQDNERAYKVIRENSIEGRARKIAEERGVDLQTLLREAKRKMNK